MEKTSSKAKIIFHIDFNAFFCSVAEIYNPALRNQAFAIGRENSNYGVISTSSYAARKYGIYSGMSLKEAFMKLPSLKVVSLPYEKYLEYHKKFINILKEYTDLIEVGSIDEAYIDVTDYCKEKHPLIVAKEIQNRLLREYHLPCSIGIAPNLFLAKMASDMQKPLGITVLRIRDIKEKLYPLSVKEIFGIGKKTYPKLMEAGIKTIGDFVNPGNKDLILTILSTKFYDDILGRLSGKSRKEIDTMKEHLYESISSMQTYDRRLSDEEEILYEFKKIATDVYRRLKENNYYTKTISITLRNLEFETITRSITISDYTDDFYIIFDLIVDLFYANYKGDTLRLLGVAFSNLVKEEFLVKDYNLFTIANFLNQEDKIKSLVAKINANCGQGSIQLGIDSKKTFTSKTSSDGVEAPDVKATLFTLPKS